MNQLSKRCRSVGITRPVPHVVCDAVVLYCQPTGLQRSGSLLGPQPPAYLSRPLRRCPVWDDREAPASDEHGAYALRQSALLGPTLCPSRHTKGNSGANGVGWREFSLEAEDTGGVGEREPCFKMGAVQGAVVLRGWGGCWGPQAVSLHISSLGHPQHGAATTMVQESSRLRTFVDVRWEPAVTTQERPLPCFPLQLCWGATNPTTVFSLGRTALSPTARSTCRAASPTHGSLNCH